MYIYTRMRAHTNIHTTNSLIPLQAKAEKEGFTLGKSSGSFKANSKALAELESTGIAKCLFNKDTGKVLGVHIIGIHASDLIQVLELLVYEALRYLSY